MSRVRNPILPGCHPDPSICRVGDDYYLVTSTFEYFPGLPVFHSTDLAHWECVGHVVARGGQLDYAGIASSGGLYAPTIRHHDGRFWVVCTLVDQQDESRGGNVLMTATDAAGPWSDPIWLDADGIDPSLFFDIDGRVWLHGTRPAREPAWPGQTEVWLREYDPVGEALVGPETLIWTGALFGAVWAEGPHLYRVDGRYYLVAAEGGTEFHHAVCVARADSVTGPYTGNPGNPVLTHRHLGRESDVVGAGHADLVQAADGSWWAVLLAMRPYGGYHYPLGRETFLVPVTWEDGWPVFAPGVGRVPGTVEVPFAASGKRGAAQGGGSGLVRPNDLRWTSLRAPAAGFATPNGDGWRLELTATGLADPATPAFLGVRQQHRDLDLTVTLRVCGVVNGDSPHRPVDDGMDDGDSPHPPGVDDGDCPHQPGSTFGLKPGEEAGLVLRQSERDHVRLSLIAGADGPVARAIHRRAGVDTVLGEVALNPTPAAPVRLGVRVRGVDYELLVFDELVATADGRTLDSVATGGFLGLWLGVHGTTNGGPPGTVLEVESFEYCPRNPIQD